MCNASAVAICIPTLVSSTLIDEDDFALHGLRLAAMVAEDDGASPARELATDALPPRRATSAEPRVAGKEPEEKSSFASLSARAHSSNPLEHKAPRQRTLEFAGEEALPPSRRGLCGDFCTSQSAVEAKDAEVSEAAQRQQPITSQERSVVLDDTDATEVLDFDFALCQEAVKLCGPPIPDSAHKEHIGCQDAGTREENDLLEEFAELCGPPLAEKTAKDVLGADCQSPQIPLEVQEKFAEVEMPRDVESVQGDFSCDKPAGVLSHDVSESASLELLDDDFGGRGTLGSSFAAVATTISPDRNDLKDMKESMLDPGMASSAHPETPLVSHNVQHELCAIASDLDIGATALSGSGEHLHNATMEGDTVTSSVIADGSQSQGAHADTGMWMLGRIPGMSSVDKELREELAERHAAVLESTHLQEVAIDLRAELVQGSAEREEQEALLEETEHYFQWLLCTGEEEYAGSQEEAGYWFAEEQRALDVEERACEDLRRWRALETEHAVSERDAQKAERDALAAVLGLRQANDELLESLASAQKNAEEGSQRAEIFGEELEKKAEALRESQHLCEGLEEEVEQGILQRSCIIGEAASQAASLEEYSAHCALAEQQALEAESREGHQRREATLTSRRAMKELADFQEQETVRRALPRRTGRFPRFGFCASGKHPTEVAELCEELRSLRNLASERGAEAEGEFEEEAAAHAAWTEARKRACAVEALAAGEIHDLARRVLREERSQEEAAARLEAQEEESQHMRARRETFNAREEVRNSSLALVSDIPLAVRIPSYDAEYQGLIHTKIRYTIVVEGPGATLTLRRRFSEFRELHESLIGKPFAASLKALPQEWVFASFSTTLLERRRRHLEAYLCCLCSHASVLLDSTIWNWLAVDELTQVTSRLVTANAMQWPAEVSRLVAQLEVIVAAGGNEHRCVHPAVLRVLKDVALDMDDEVAQAAASRILERVLLSSARARQLFLPVPAGGVGTGGATVLLEVSRCGNQAARAAAAQAVASLLEELCSVDATVMVVHGRLRDREEEASAAAEEARGLVAGAPEECCVCLDHERSHALLPCGHFCTCMDCADYLAARHDPCPICRRSIEQAVQIFV